jgi:hypothetical protein
VRSEARTWPIASTSTSSASEPESELDLASREGRADFAADLNIYDIVAGGRCSGRNAREARSVSHPK